jgi:hypothetical protein
METDRSLPTESNTALRDQIKDLEKEFKAKFFESLLEQLDKKAQQLKNQTNVLRKQKELC